VDFTSALSELDTILGDSSDVTFTSAEKTRALTRAWNDQYVVVPVWDDSLTYSQGTYQYSLDTMTVLQDIYLSPTGSSQPMPEPIEGGLWSVIDGQIQFSAKADAIIPTGYTLYLKGLVKLTTADSLPTVNLQEYVLALAGVNTLTLLGYKKANLFVKNDLTMAELIGLRRELMVDVREGRLRLQKEYQSA
jgi:hypothetical protein